jgi:uncharacterized protein (TIGR03067 family)
MRHHAFVIFPVALAFLAYTLIGDGDNKSKGTKAEAMKKELKRLAGTWELAHWGQDGLLVDRSEWDRIVGKQNQRFTIREDGTLGGPPNPTNGGRNRYVLDPTTAPKTMDLYGPLDKGGESLSSVGIYELDGDEWTVCYAAAVRPRPTDFTFKRGSQHIYKVYRRVKDKK